MLLRSPGALLTTKTLKQKAVCEGLPGTRQLFLKRAPLLALRTQVWQHGL